MKRCSPTHAGGATSSVHIAQPGIVLFPATVMVAMGLFLAATGDAVARSPTSEVRRAHKGDPVVRPHVRVLSERAAIYSGPGFGFRLIAEARRDDVLLMIERGKRGGWTRVQLRSGLLGWVLAEQVSVFSAEPAADEPAGPLRRLGRKLREHVLGPSNLMTARIGGTLSAGAFGREGLFLVRPSLFVAPHVALEAYLGPTAGKESNRGLFGLGANVYVSPEIPFSVFVSAGVGAIFSKGKADALPSAVWRMLVSPGAGVWIIFKHGVGIRFDFRNHLIVRADHALSRQEYSGALAFTF